MGGHHRTGRVAFLSIQRGVWSTFAKCEKTSVSTEGGGRAERVGFGGATGFRKGWVPDLARDARDNGESRGVTEKSAGARKSDARDAFVVRSAFCAALACRQRAWASLAGHCWSRGLSPSCSLYMGGRARGLSLISTQSSSARTRRLRSASSSASERAFPASVRARTLDLPISSRCPHCRDPPACRSIESLS